MARHVGSGWRMKPRYRPVHGEDIGVDSIAVRIERNLEVDRIADENRSSVIRRDAGSIPASRLDQSLGCINFIPTQHKVYIQLGRIIYCATQAQERSENGNKTKIPNNGVCAGC